jgi:hypothetical protein
MLQSRFDRDRIYLGDEDKNDGRPKFNPPQPTTARPNMHDFFAEFRQKSGSGERKNAVAEVEPGTAGKVFRGILGSQ